MAGYRSTVISRINWVSAKIPLDALIQLSGQKVVLPVYHLASDEEVPHIKHLYKIKNLLEFNRDLEFLLRNFEPIDLSTLIDYVEQRRTLKKPSFLLSFDDGLQEFYTDIAPILLAKGIPATNFLNSSFIDNKGLFFRYKVSLIIDQLQKETNVQSLKVINEILEIDSIPVKKLISVMLKLRYSDVEKIDRVAQILNIDFKQFLNEKQPYLTSQQIRDLKSQGFSFGAHSVDHPRYSEVSFPEQIRQTEASVTQISERFDLDHRIFAFPFTDYQVSKSYFDHFFHHKKLLDLSFGSAGLKRDIYPQHLQRIPMEMGKMTAEQIIHGEYFYYLLKGMLGKNRIERI